MTPLDPYQEGSQMACRFSSKIDQDGVIALGDRYVVIAKSLRWNSARLLTSLDPSWSGCWMTHSPEYFSEDVWRFSWRDDVMEPESRQRRFTVFGASLGVFSSTFLNDQDTVIPFDGEAVGKEAQEEGFKAPREATLECAKAVSLALPSLGVLASEVAIYPMPDGEVAVDVFRGPEGNRSSIIFLCGTSGGSLQCLTHINGENNQQEMSVEDYPNRFVRQAFAAFMGLK